MSENKDNYLDLKKYGVENVKPAKLTPFQELFVTLTESGGEISAEKIQNIKDNLSNFKIENFTVSKEGDGFVVKCNKDNESLNSFFRTYETEDKANKAIKDACKEMPKKAALLDTFSNRTKKGESQISAGEALESTPNYDASDAKIKSLTEPFKSKLLQNVYLDENIKYHPERNSLVHIKIVVARGINIGDEDLIDAALFHDIAKFEGVETNKDGWPTAPRHDIMGAKYAQEAGKNAVVQYICANHMKIKGWNGESEGGTLGDDKKLEMLFTEKDDTIYKNPGQNLIEKLKNFWKVVTFSTMDNMNNPFDQQRYETIWTKIEAELKEAGNSLDKTKLIQIWNGYDTNAPFPLPKEEKKVEPKVEPKEGELNLKSLKSILGSLNLGQDFNTVLTHIQQFNFKTKEEVENEVKNWKEDKPSKVTESRKWVMTYENFKNNQ
jgi:hypothetical protein